MKKSKNRSNEGQLGKLKANAERTKRTNVPEKNQGSSPSRANIHESVKKARWQELSPEEDEKFKKRKNGYPKN